ncbi:MAG TPA: 4Fe-4S binding protein [Termitinemataceae bacterium]|jgi:polyferredoxin|nr:4Fe-4S binding protein [Termitinemataceae bacterium]HOM23672.1 4Fe-4S binding protein [Termitinemataceae bacterium]HPP99413.1 4Fe-4S binding protein [Termitinemataceae bacterium]
MPAKKKSVASKLRLGIQLVFLLLITLISVNHGLSETGIQIPFVGNPSLHGICPFGGVVSLYQLVTTGSLVQKVHEASVVLMALVFFLAVLFGPVFCGWVCPMGTVQELIGKLGKKLFKKRYNHFVPSRLDGYLRFLRYGVLVWVVYVTATSMKLVFSDVDPYYALFNFWTGEVPLTALIILGLTLIASLFIERPFCKYACPYGALLGIFNIFRIFGIKRNQNTCINCKACDRACPMNISVSTSTTVRHHQCITCLQCTSETACPVPATVELMAGNFSLEAKGAQKVSTEGGAQ